MDGSGLGIWLHPTTGQVFVSETVYTSLGIAIWIGGIVAGLVTSWLVLP